MHDRPDNGQAAGFRREGVNLVSPLPHIAKETFNGIGAANVTMHDWWKGIKREQMGFIFTEAAKRFRIPLLVFGFKSC